MSEESDGGRKRNKRNVRLRTTGLDLLARSQPVPEALSGEEEGALSHEGSELGVLTPSPSQLLTAKEQLTAKGPGELFLHSPVVDSPSTRPSAPSRTNSARVLKLRGYRTSLPSLRPPSTIEDTWREGSEDDAMRAEYERRLQYVAHP
jgi:hypothetical protein